MSDPASLLFGTGLGMQAFGMFGQGQAASAQAKSQAAMAEYNAKVAEQQAAAQRQATLYRQRKMAEEASRNAASMRAGLGTSGAVSSEGTPLLIQAKQAAEDELNMIMTGYEGDIASRRLLAQAGGERMQAGIYSQAAGNASTAGMIGAGTTLLQGFGQLYKPSPSSPADPWARRMNNAALLRY